MLIKARKLASWLLQQSSKVKQVIPFDSFQQIEVLYKFNINMF